MWRTGLGVKERVHVHEQDLRTQERRDVLPGNLSDPDNFALLWPEPGPEKSLYFQPDFIFYIFLLLKLHPVFFMGGIPSQLREGSQKSYKKS